MKRYEPIINMIMQAIGLFAGGAALYILLFSGRATQDQQDHQDIKGAISDLQQTLGNIENNCYLSIKK